MELLIKNKDYISISVKWNEINGYTTKIGKVTNLVSEKDISRIVQIGVPSGSNWAKYSEFRSIKIWQDELKSKRLIFISFCFIEKVYTKEGIIKTVPQVNIYILDENEVASLVSIGFEKFVNLINHNNEKVYKNLDIYSIHSLGSIKKKMFMSLRTDVVMKKSESWKFIELPLLKEFFEKWPNFESFSTLTTPQDNFDNFRYNCMLEEDLKELKSKDSIIFYLDKGYFLYPIKEDKINYIFDRFLSSLKFKFEITVWKSIIISIIPLLLYFLFKILFKA